MSLASFATSVPPPIAKPTSAFLSAGESFTPSPVIPTTKFSSCANLTNRLLSLGNALATTLKSLSLDFNSSSESENNSSLVNTTSLSDVKSPASFAMATAVSFLSPVIITTCTPALCTSCIASMDSGRTSSRMPNIPTNI